MVSGQGDKYVIQVVKVSMRERERDLIHPGIQEPIEFFTLQGFARKVSLKSEEER